MNTRISIFFLTLYVASFASCVETPGVPDSGPGNVEPPPAVITIDDLKLRSFTIAPQANATIYAPIAFAADEQGVWRGQVEHYTADVTQLKALFEAVAAKVTVGDVKQESGVTVNDFSKSIVYRLYADDGQYKEFSVALENGTGTGVPLVVLFTENETPITSKEKWIAGRFVVDPQLSGCEKADMVMEIKGRGNNTWMLDKKPYAIKLAEKYAVMGMNKHKRWVLLANAKDRTLMRNRVAFEIARRTGLEWTPDGRFVDVILNGKYVGSYYLCEQIKIDKNRVNVDEMETGDMSGEAVTGGYLLEFDRYYDEINKFRTTLRDLPVNVKEPDEKVFGAVQKQYISDYVNSVETLLYAGATPDPAYREKLDVDSYIDWWIVMELTTNRDSRLPGSCYMYKKRSGKLYAGPVWDFDLTTFKLEPDFLLYNYETTDFSNPRGDRSLWYKRLFADPQFKARAKERWLQFKSGSEGFEGIPDFIDAEAVKLRVSAEVNWEIWTIDGAPNHDETLAWDAAVEKLKSNYKARMKSLDDLIARW